MKSFILAVAAIAVFAGCVTKPTVVTDTPARVFEGAAVVLGPIRLDETTVILDARPAFDYSVGRVPRSFNINWFDYSEREPKMRGWPQKDLFAAARRLARMGISPDSKVVVFGNGPEGQGEEGRIAWMLAYLGVNNVQFARFGSVKSRLTTEATPEMARTNFDNNEGFNALGSDPSRDSGAGSDGRAIPEKKSDGTAIWKPEPIRSLIASRDEVKGSFEARATERPWSFNGRPVKLFRLVDVRPSSEYLGKSGGIRARKIPNLDAINVPWKEFFDSNMRPEKDIAARLVSVGVRPEHRVIVLDNDGVASCAVTMALRALGYSDAGCYAGGYNDLLP